MVIKRDSVTRFAADVTQMEFRGKVFANRGVETVDARVDEHGTVRVWDEVAGHWTTCHSISQCNQRAIVAAARE
jgi:hypothetical protein